MNRLLWLLALTMLGCPGPSPVGPDGGASDDTTLGAMIKPEVVVMLDTSGSLTSTFQPSCTVGTCPTRWSVVTSLVENLLAAQSSEARFGLVSFPSDNVCGAPTGWVRALPTGADDAPTLSAWSSMLAAQLATLMPRGGTPTSLAVNFVAQNSPPLTAGRERFAVLITDGVPNCNPNNPANSCGGASSCQCVVSSCAGTLCALGCLDESAAVTSLSALRSTGVATVVVGVGVEVEKSAPLTAMATAGGAPVTCPGGTAAECGGDSTCLGTSCSVPYLSVQTSDGLTRSLGALGQRIRRSGRCHWALTQPLSAAQLRVSVGGTALADSQWSLSGQVVTLLGSSCDAVLGDPMPVVRITKK